MTRKLPVAALALALSGSAGAATVALFDFADNRGAATAQNFIDTGMTLVSSTDVVTTISSATLDGAVSGTPFALGATGISLSIDDTSSAFTYGNSPWSGHADVALMGDAWLFNNLGSSGVKNITLTGFSATLAANTIYRVYFLGSYSGPEFTQFGSITYGTTNYGSISTTQIAGADGSASTGTAISNISSMAASVDFTTGSSVSNTLTFTVGKAPTATGGAAGIQGIAIVAVGAVPEPSSYGLAGASALGALALVRRRKKAL